MSVDRTQTFFHQYANHFDAIYGNQNGFVDSVINRLFRKSMKLRYEKTIEGCNPIANKSVLDIGCGPGHYSITLAQRGASRVVGIDFAEGVFAVDVEVNAGSDEARRKLAIVAEAGIVDFRGVARGGHCPLDRAIPGGLGAGRGVTIRDCRGAARTGGDAGAAGGVATPLPPGVSAVLFAAAGDGCVGSGAARAAAGHGSAPALLPKRARGACGSARGRRAVVRSGCKTSWTSAKRKRFMP